VKGTSFQYEDCVTAGVLPGNSGANVTWDFSNLSPKSSTVTQVIASPTTVVTGSLFPSSTFLEQLSDGTELYITKSAGTSVVDGIHDPNGPFTMVYSDPMELMKRPVTFGAQFVDAFANTFTVSSYKFSGKGTSTITADGYGTLILPTKTYSNVLRVKRSYVEQDSMLQFGSVSTSTYVTFLWFSNTNVNSLLTIDSLKSSSSTAPPLKSVSYLIDNSPVTTDIGNVAGIDNIFGFFPNPAEGEVNVIATETGELKITDALGNVVGSMIIENKTLTINTCNYPSGVYILTFKTERSLSRNRLILR